MKKTTTKKATKTIPEIKEQPLECTNCNRKYFGDGALCPPCVQV